MNAAQGEVAYFSWRSYGVSMASKTPIYTFLREALEARGARIIHQSRADRAPLLLVFETNEGVRHAALVYAFLANAKQTHNRPDDEHRFQIKYGGDHSGSIDVAIDPHELITTLFIGVDPEREIIVSADPLRNTPAPQSRSVEFKTRNVAAIRSDSWSAWERERRAPKTANRPAYRADEDLRTEVLVGARKERFLDLLAFERIARGLEPGDRHLLADKLANATAELTDDARAHPLLDELALSADDLLDLIVAAPRLKMAVRGWTAEHHLETTLREVPGVTECHRLSEDGQPDLRVRWQDGPPVLIECKNALRLRTASGLARVDFQRTRASKSDPSSRYYSPRDFQVLAVCLHAVEGEWRYQFALTADLARHKEYADKIASAVQLAEPPFTSSIEDILTRASADSSRR